MVNSTNIGLEDNQRKEIADHLSRVLANTFVLYGKTHGYHWNVKGIEFPGLHTMFEEQYTQLFEALDELAERIRALGVDAPHSPTVMATLATVSNDNANPDAKAMVEALLNDHEIVIRDLRVVIAKAAELGDEGTADMLTARMEEHEKTAWMLRATAG